MDMYHLIGIVSGLVSILANSSKACEAISKGWSSFTKFLRTLNGPDEVDTDGGLILSGQVSTSVILGGTATGSASSSATLS